MYIYIYICIAVKIVLHSEDMCGCSDKFLEPCLAHDLLLYIWSYSSMKPNFIILSSRLV